MGLIDRLSAGVPTRQPAFETIVAGLPPEERKALMKAAINRDWSDRDLVRILQDEGIVIGEAAFAAWRGAAKAMITGSGPVSDQVPQPVKVPTPTTDFSV